MKVIDRRPALFEKSACNIWTDPYIQQQMLKEHLNPVSDGATRKHESVLKITDFIIRHTKPASKLLDLGCGPGLYASLLKHNGYDVTGIDFNKTSIEYAAKSQNDIEYLYGDYMKAYPLGKYDTVMMIYCDMGTHSDNNRNKLLENIYHSLNSGGVFVFDVFSEGITKDKQETKSWEYAQSGGFWFEQEYLLLSQTFHYPENKAFVYQYNLLTINEKKHFIMWDRYYSENEIINILKSIGFDRVSIHKNILNGNNFTSDSEMYIVAEKV